MQPRLLDILVCPDCRQRLALEDAVRAYDDEIESALLMCPTGHAFPVVAGIPRLLGQNSGQDLDRVRDSFSREWTHHQLGDRTWYLDLETRVRTAFIEVLGMTPEGLLTKTVLDAGCGNGCQSVAFTEFVREVIAIDVSTGLEMGNQLRTRWPRGRADAVYFVQADICNPPVPSRSVDVVYSFGVLHHTPDTGGSFDALVPLLRPRGTLYIRVYHYERFGHRLFG